MLSCEDLCLFCNSPQNYKVNFLLIHGVCVTHSSNLQEFLQCKHCFSLLPFTKYSQILQCQSCLQNRVIGLLPCGHYLCVDCEVVCSLCRLGSMFSNNTEIKDSLRFGHPVCKDCNIKKCPLCSEAALKLTESLIEESKKCEYCLKNIIETNCTNNHNLCKSCGINKCPICELSQETKKTLCDSCIKNEAVATCVHGHNICDQCNQKCYVCAINSGSTEQSLQTNSRSKNSSFMDPKPRVSVSENCDKCSSAISLSPCPTCDKRHCQKCSKSHGSLCKPIRTPSAEPDSLSKSASSPDPTPNPSQLDLPPTDYKSESHPKNGRQSPDPKSNMDGSTKCCCTII